jgi:hypothetical protein
MNKTTVILNDFGSNIKSYITYDRPDIDKVLKAFDEHDDRLTKLQVLEPFRGYEKWSELSPGHFRILVTRGLNTLAKLTPEERQDSGELAVSTTNFLILCFIICLEQRTESEIEHFRINRFDELNVTFDYSASFELEYNRPSPKTVEVEPTPATPAFSIVIDNSDEPGKH